MPQAFSQNNHPLWSVGPFKKSCFLAVEEHHNLEQLDRQETWSRRASSLGAIGLLKRGAWTSHKCKAKGTWQKSQARITS